MLGWVYITGDTVWVILGHFRPFYTNNRWYNQNFKKTKKNL